MTLNVCVKFVKIHKKRPFFKVFSPSGFFEANGDIILHFGVNSGIKNGKQIFVLILSRTVVY
jgi:hypothetical protein